MKWQPIDTAPRDGSWMLLLWPMTRTSVIVSGQWYQAKDGDEFWWGNPRVDSKHEPTHWMPLPEPPTN